MLSTPTLRFDRGSILDRVRRTPTGGAVVPARIGRTGVLVYRDSTGSTRREYRPESEAFAPGSLASLEDAVVTVGHPPGALITPETVREHGVGHVKPGARRDARYILAELAVLDAAALKRIDARELVDCSSGYSCVLEHSPGTTPEGEPYDAIQRSVIYNHVALLPAGMGRAGPEVGLRTDAIEIRIDDRAALYLPPTALFVAGADPYTPPGRR